MKKSQYMQPRAGGSAAILLLAREKKERGWRGEG